MKGYFHVISDTLQEQGVARDAAVDITNEVCRELEQEGFDIVRIPVADTNPLGEKPDSSGWKRTPGMSA